MRLASLPHGRDGRLVVVSDDLDRCADATSVAPTMQALLDDWDRLGPAVQGLNADLAAGRVEGQPFDPAGAAAPLPRAYQWADGSAYVNHVELVRRARGATMPASFWTDPLMYQGASDRFIAPNAPIEVVDESWGFDFEAEVVVVTGDVPQGSSAAQCLSAVRLVGLANDISLRNLIPAELAKGFGFFQSKPASSLSPVMVTPDALEGIWSGGKLSGSMMVDLNGRPFGRARAEVDMTFDFGTLIAHAARTRSLVAGSIIGSGTISNRGDDGGPGRPIAAGGLGYSCLAETRMVETILHGGPVTPFLRLGDTVRIWMEDASGQSMFGAIEQPVTR